MTDATAATTDHRSRAGSLTRVGSGVMVVLLLIQYVLGLAYNLFGPAPSRTNPLQMFSNALLGAHSGVGMLLILGAIVVLITSIRARHVMPVIAAVVGIVSIIGAFASGTAFLPAGADAASMTMGALLALALLSYASVPWTRTTDKRTPATA